MSTTKIVVRVAPIATFAVQMEPEKVAEGRLFVNREAVGKLNPTQKTIPVVLDHDMDRQVGVVEEFCVWDDLEPQMMARCVIHEPPAWLKKGTPTSWSYWPLWSKEFGAGDHLMSGLAREVSLLSPGVQPAEPTSCVRLVQRVEASRPAARASSLRSSITSDEHRAYVEAARAAKPGILIRPGIGRVLGVR